jgi:putative phosphoesterase
MKIGVLSDTHLRTPDSDLEYILEELFGDADMILHAGDIVSSAVLERLEERGVLAVCGNMDDYEVAAAIPQARVITVERKRIGLIHGWGSKEGLAERVVARFSGDLPDVIVFGHSHVPFWGKAQGVYLFNPGSARQDRYTGPGTVGVLKITDAGIEAEFLTVERSKATAEKSMGPKS